VGLQAGIGIARQREEGVPIIRPPCSRCRATVGAAPAWPGRPREPAANASCRHCGGAEEVLPTGRKCCQRASACPRRSRPVQSVLTSNRRMA